MKHTERNEEVKGKTIYDLELNEWLHAPMQWNVRIDILKVAGGWIYQPINRTYNGNDIFLSPCFVPYNEEFLNKNKKRSFLNNILSKAYSATDVIQFLNDFWEKDHLKHEGTLTPYGYIEMYGEDKIKKAFNEQKQTNNQHE